ncbi:MAG: phosphotransferase [Jatrophihabitans sp.]
MTFPDGPVIGLPPGDVTVGVVRIGRTVRRPHQPTSDGVAAYLAHLDARGFAGAPRYLGRDTQGRDVLTFLDGDVPGDPVDEWATVDAVLPGVARLVRRLHDASQGFDLPAGVTEPDRPAPQFPAGEPVLVAHRDVTPQNTVFRAGVASGLIDFDLSNRTTRALDLANTAMHWVPLCDPADRAPAHAGIDVGQRLRLMLDAYGRDLFDGAGLLAAAEMRFAGSYAFMHWAALHRGGGWARMWAEGVGDVIRRRIAWFADVRQELRDALDA